MINKKLMIFAIFLVSLLAVSSVSAADNTTSDIVGVEETTDEVVSVESPADYSAGVENQDEGLISEIDSNVLTANPTTFADLNALINGNDDSDVYLKSNYTFSMDSDSDFIEGIYINRAVTVHGNGHTIDGDNSAKIFYVESSDVVFKDIVFVNAHSFYGGAINGGSAVNCTFTGNSAEYGGAMNGGFAVNCTFINNAAKGEYGGAIHEGSAVNCTFIDNFAVFGGGAISGGPAVNCTFIGNSAYIGGAIHEGSAVNCTFIDNTASYCGGAVQSVSGDFVNCIFVSNSAGTWGGAISGADYINVVDCTFINNSANDDAGAIWSAGSVVNCTFINNSASGSGGAVGSFRDMPITNSIFIGNIANNGGAASYQVIISNSKFSNNTARECGGAIMEGICINSTFTNNHAAKDGGAIYDVAVVNCSFEYNSAENGGAMRKGTAKNCTFNYNSATAYGGAIYDAKVSTDSKFNNNKAPNGKDTYNVTWIENSNAKTFTDLKNLIEESSSEVYLNDNYTFDLISDTELMEGIPIYSDVTIHGNDFTIDGNNIARIFRTGNNYVVFRDIVFANARFAGEGGAIEGYCTVVNCTFINNFAVAGVMVGCSAVNCTFINNYGGTIFEGSAVNCIFINNHDGAMWGGSAENCIFIGNSGDYGAAIAVGGSAVNCIFINNSASIEGGAMDGGSAVNCIFIGNSAFFGGAIYGGFFAVNCTFINNSASDRAGAMNGGSAVNCTFINNTAETYGGATYYCDITDCIFKGNKAGIVGDDFYPVGFVLVVHDFTSTYKSGDKLLVYLMDDDVSIMGEEIIIKVYKKDSLIGTYQCLSGNGWVVDLDTGSYTALVSFEGNDNYPPRNATAKIVVNKADTIISAPDVSLAYKDPNGELVATITDNNGNPLSVDLNVDFNGETYTVKSDSDGQISIPIGVMTPKTYVATISYAGDENYVASNTTANVIVTKADTIISAPDVAVVYNDPNGELIATLSDVEGKPLNSANLLVNIGGVDYALKTNSKGQVKLSTVNLTIGTHTATVSYNGNAKYNPTYTTATVVVNKKDVNISIVYDNSAGELVATLTNAEGKALNSANVIITINGETYALKTFTRRLL